MTDFQVHTIESAPEGSKPTLTEAQKRLGFVPNLYAVFAEAPALLKAYTAVGEIFDKTSFTPAERQVVLLATSFENECSYCMAAHSTIAGMQKVPAEAVDAVRTGGRLSDPKLDALATFTRRVVQENGWVSEEEIQAFLGAGYTKAQLLELLVGVAFKTMSNFTNHIAETPLDDAFAPNAWSPPETSTVS